MDQLKKGALLNYISIILTNIVGILMTPFILKCLGSDQYGIYLTVGALIGTISLLDFGLNNTIVRFVAKYKAEKNIVKEENFLATVMIIYAVISFLVLLIGALFYNYLDSYFGKMTVFQIEIAKMMFAVLILNISLTLPGGVFLGICLGYEKFVFPKLLNIIRYILRSLTVLIILNYGGKAISLVLIDSFFNVIVVLISGHFVFTKLKVRFKLHSLNSNFIKEILMYSIWIFVFALVGVFQWKAGHWILGSMSIPSVLAIYGIGITLGSYYGAFSTAISSVFLPRATQMSVANASGEELTDMMIKIGRLSFIVLMYIFIFFSLYGLQFVNLWVGGELGSQGSFEAWLIALLIMGAYTIPLVQNFGNSILEAKNKLAFKATIYLLFMVLGTLIGYFLAKNNEALGMVVGSVLGWFIVQNIMNVYYYKVIKINIPRFFKELLNKTLLVFIVISAIGYSIRFLPGEGWINFIFKGGTFTLLFIVLVYFSGLNKYEKELFEKPIIQIVKKVSNGEA